MKNSSSYRSFEEEPSEVGRKRSLIRRDRTRLTPDDPQYHYAQVVAQEADHLNVEPSTSNYNPVADEVPLEDLHYEREEDSEVTRLKGKEVYGLNDETAKRQSMPIPMKKQKPSERFVFWPIYCQLVTFWAPAPLLSLFGMKTKDRQFAWREKIGLVTVILYMGAFVAYLTFGFTRTVCSNQPIRVRNNEVSNGYIIVNGRAFDLTRSSHPQAAGIPAGSNVLYPPINAGGQDGSFLFQNVNGNCKDLITPRENCSIPYDDDGNLAWYMPCNLFKQDGSSSPNFTEPYYPGWGCHTSATARDAYYSMEVTGNVYFTWDDVRNSTRRLIVYNGDVLDLSLLDWLETDDLEYPAMFDELREDDSLTGFDVSMVLTSPAQRRVAKCLVETVKVGTIDSETIGCIASQVVLYVSLIFILAVVVSKFFVACYFRWVLSRKQGAFTLDNKQMAERDRELERWADGDGQGTQEPGIQGAQLLPLASRGLPNRKSIAQRQSRVLDPFTMSHEPSNKSLSIDTHPNVIPQPPTEYQPFGFPLAHTINLVTCYSEDEEGLRVTIDSIAQTDYPNSHKMVLVLCDGLIKGAGNDKTTPDIVLDMMTDFAVPRDQVQPYSYVAVASGSKRHNMAKVYAGFYKYNDDTVPPELQVPLPMITVVKCGTPQEHGAAKPGNRGKRDSQIILMSFLQKITFDERMTELEYELLTAFWRVTGLMADMYEIVLMVDADTKVFPDSLTHMVAEMVKDPEIMGLCGETKIANKTQSWVTAIQVFEYYISHHQAKAFESAFGSVTCLPGCFCMYRIKAPKQDHSYWVPILANPDIVERYSDNNVQTLHKKNLLLLGEDRYLSSLMLRTFPKRKQVFVPKAVCKTVVPDKFKILLSQRRRWINSTVHNLMELVLVRDLCGTFCFSMQFVIGIELIGTMVLPAAICFTIYVIIVAIISHPTPVLSLVLLAVIFGLPGLLVVITVSSWSYVMWFFVYLIALPIWNFVLPTYAYWKFDDFSWGDTRKTSDAAKNAHEAEGEFDGSSIVMKRWREFERDKRASGLAHPRATWDPSMSLLEIN